jgi:hypothetical protein
MKSSIFTVLLAVIMPYVTTAAAEFKVLENYMYPTTESTTPNNNEREGGNAKRLLYDDDDDAVFAPCYSGPKDKCYTGQCTSVYQVVSMQ